MEKELKSTHCAMYKCTKKRLPILKINIKKGTVQEIPREKTKCETEEISSPFQKSISEMVKKRKRKCSEALLNENSKSSLLTPFSKLSKVERQRKNEEKCEDNFLENQIDYLVEIDLEGKLPQLTGLHNYLFNDESVTKNEGNN